MTKAKMRSSRHRMNNPKTYSYQGYQPEDMRPTPSISDIILAAAMSMKRKYKA